ncbi:DUF342 domain-containing protein [Anaerosalibacter massiliensis]|uniref:FapA family protein n=1 Tax=Anaerosalibacter massiliensis TaxID=1347392 RepID=A0A9X2MFJ7_9FIRM|nr:FapA family protein [Anaerosalibacter massiliensis]MCR2042744.1 FapA family protein [Anaerosalibacter massiliensis]
MKYGFEEKIFVEVSRNGLEGYLTLISDDKDLNFDFNNTISIIKEKIKLGLKSDIIKDMIDNKIYKERVCIAEGVYPINEKDGYVKYYFDKNKKLMPKINEDGTVDYRELDLVNNVSEGDILAKIILPSGGKEGLKVTGEKIPYRQGKTPFFKCGKNVKTAGKGLYLVSTHDGQVKLVDNKLNVLEVLEVSSVDNSTGNIDFNGSIIVKGNVINGFKVKADGDIEILGVVEGADIECTGDISVRQGIQGCNSGEISSMGNIVTKFIENSNIFCKRNLVAEAIMHSEVICNNSVDIIGKRGLLVGGICRARKEIRAKTVGSRMATSTILEVGVEPEYKIKSNNLAEEISTTKSNISKVEKSLFTLEKLVNSNKINEEKKQLYKKLENTRRVLEMKLNKINKEYTAVKSMMKDISEGCIKVEGTVYPGVKIVIGDSTMFVREELKNCTFYKEEGEIKIAPY